MVGKKFDRREECSTVTGVLPPLKAFFKREYQLQAVAPLETVAVTADAPFDTK